MQRVSSQARAAELHSTDVQAELRHQQEVAEERDAEIRRLHMVSHLPRPLSCTCVQDSRGCSSVRNEGLASLRWFEGVANQLLAVHWLYHNMFSRQHNGMATAKRELQQ